MTKEEILGALEAAEILDAKIDEITIIDPDAGHMLDGRWHLLPYGPTHGFWDPYGKDPISICEGMLDIYPERYYCDVCQEEYPMDREAHDKVNNP